MWSFAVALLGLGIDYVRVRTNLYELERLRVETREQRDQIQTYAERMEAISTKLARIDGFERKLRIITNLDPADPLPLPGIGGTDGEMLSADDVSWMSRGKRNEVMKEGLETLAGAMDAQDESLQGLIHHLEDQSARLVHTPVDHADPRLDHVALRLPDGSVHGRPRVPQGHRHRRPHGHAGLRGGRRRGHLLDPEEARWATRSSSATATTWRRSTATSSRPW